MSLTVKAEPVDDEQTWTTSSTPSAAELMQVRNGDVASLEASTSTIPHSVHCSLTSVPSNQDHATSTWRKEEEVDVHVAHVQERTPRQIICEMLSSCARVRSHKHLISALMSCVSAQDDSSFPDIKLHSHLESFREMCYELPESSSLASLIGFHDCHTRIISLTQDLALGRNSSITAAIEADERATADAMLSKISSDPWDESILRLQDSAANKFLNLLQQAIDGLGPFAYDQAAAAVHRPRACHLFLKLSKESNVIPSSLFLKRVQVDRSQRAFGRGRYADVYCGTYDDVSVAVKLICYLPDAHATMHRRFCREALPWRQLQHPRILQFLGVDEDSFAPSLCMILPLMEKGNVQGYLQDCEMATVDLLEIAAEIAEGMEYLHREHIVHGDLRASNILVDEEGHIRISDFGLVSFMESELAQWGSSGTVGNPRWLSPELLNPSAESTLHSFSSDVYSLACVFLEIFTGQPPFHGTPDRLITIKVVSGQHPCRPNQRDTRQPLHDDIWALMLECWELNPQERPVATSICEILRKQKSQGRSSKHDATLPVTHESIPKVFNSSIGLGQAVLRLLQLSGELSQSSSDKSTFSYWNTVMNEFFMLRARLTLVAQADSNNFHPKNFSGLQILQWFLDAHQSGVERMSFALDGARERQVGPEHSVVECVNAHWTWCFATGYSVTYRGSLTAHIVAVSRAQALPQTLQINSLQFEGLNEGTSPDFEATFFNFQVSGHAKERGNM